METYLTIIQYDSEADQVFLVQNITHIYAYSEDPVTGTNAMLSVMNAEQMEALRSKGYKIQTIEQNPNLDSYILLYHTSPDQGNLLSDLGSIYLLSDYHTLLKLNEGVQFESTGKAAEFVILPLDDMREQIAGRNEVNLSISPVQDNNTSQEVKLVETVTTTPSKSPIDFMGSYILIGGIVLTVLLIMFAFVYMKKTKATDN